MITVWLLAYVIAVALGRPVEPDQQNSEGHRDTGLYLITRSPQSEMDLPPNEIHSRHQYERRNTIKVLLDESIKNQISRRKNSSDTQNIGNASLGEF